eukprot:2805435-Pleurochrysis_carterae.AAC.1
MYYRRLLPDPHGSSGGDPVENQSCRNQGSPAAQFKRIQLIWLPCRGTPVELGAGISSSYTGLQSATERSLVRADSTGAKGSFAPGTPALGAQTSRGYTARGVAPKSPCSLSLAQTDVLQVKIGRGARNAASLTPSQPARPCLSLLPLPFYTTACLWIAIYEGT